MKMCPVFSPPQEYLKRQWGSLNFLYKLKTSVILPLTLFILSFTHGGGLSLPNEASVKETDL